MNMPHFFSYNATEDANSLRGKIYSAIIHCLLLLLFFINIFDMKPPEDPNAPPYVSLVQFIPAPEMKAYEDAGGSKGAPGMETNEGGSQGESKATPVTTPETETKVKEVPVQEAPKTLPSGPKPVITSSEPDVVTLPTPPKLPPVIKPSPSENSGTPTTVPSTPSKPSTTGSSGDDNTPGSGGTGTGSGSGQGSGDANTGSGSGAGGGSGTGGGGGAGGGAGSGTGTGTGDGVGVDFDAIGPLKRLRESCKVDSKILAGATVQKAVFRICVDREGYITYITYDSKSSQTRDMKYVRDAMSVAKSCKFKSNPNAPTRKECGKVTFSNSGIIQKLN